MAFKSSNINKIFVIYDKIEEIQLKEFRKELLKALGKRIKSLREDKNLSQVDIAASIIGHFDTTNLSRIEQGRTNPTIFTLFRLSKAMDLTIKDLLPE